MRYQGCVDSIASRLTSGRSERSEGHRAGSSKEFSSGVQHLPRTLPPHSPDAPKAQGPPKISPPSPSRPPPPRPWARAARAPGNGPRPGPWALGPGPRARPPGLGPGPRPLGPQAPGPGPRALGGCPGGWGPAIMLRLRWGSWIKNESSQNCAREVGAFFCDDDYDDDDFGNDDMCQPAALCYRLSRRRGVCAGSCRASGCYRVGTCAASASASAMAVRPCRVGSGVAGRRAGSRVHQASGLRGPGGRAGGEVLVMAGCTVSVDKPMARARGQCRKLPCFWLQPRGDVCGFGVGVGDGGAAVSRGPGGRGEACVEPRSPSFGSQGSSEPCWW